MNAARPIFPVLSNAAPKSLDETVRDLGTVSHVVEVKAPWVLVHASPMGVARISQELGLEVFPSKRGGEYYAVRVGAKLALVPQQLALPAAQPARPAPQKKPGSWFRMNIRNSTYAIRETQPKRRQDVRRWEVRKCEGDTIDAPYVVAFQDHQGHHAACSCPDWIYRRHDCKHIQAMQQEFGS